MWAKIKEVFAWIGWALAAIAGILFASQKKVGVAPEEAREALKKAQQQAEEVKGELGDVQQRIADAREQTDEEVKHAEHVKVSDDPSAVVDALNDVLDRVHGRSQSGGSGRENCNGCSGRH